jgi:hypothetical protein
MIGDCAATAVSIRLLPPLPLLPLLLRKQSPRQLAAAQCNEAVFDCRLAHFLMLLAFTEGVHRKGILASNASYLQRQQSWENQIIDTLHSPYRSAYACLYHC